MTSTLQVAVQGQTAECWALAALLRQRGLRVTVDESTEPPPAPLWRRPLDPRLVGELHLDYYGYRHLPFDPIVSLPLPERGLLQLWRDPARASASIEPHSPRDAQNYRAFLECLEDPRNRGRAFVHNESSLREVLDYWFDWEPLKAALAMVVLAESPGMSLDQPGSCRGCFRWLADTGPGDLALPGLLRELYQDLDGELGGPSEATWRVVPAEASHRPYSRLELDGLPLLDELEGRDQTSLFTGRLGLIQELEDLHRPGRALLTALENYTGPGPSQTLQVTQVGAPTDSFEQVESRLAESISQLPRLLSQHRAYPGQTPQAPRGGSNLIYLVDPWAAAEHLCATLLPPPKRSWWLPAGVGVGLLALAVLRKTKGDE